MVKRPWALQGSNHSLLGLYYSQSVGFDNMIECRTMYATIDIKGFVDALEPNNQGNNNPTDKLFALLGGRPQAPVCSL